MNKNTKSLGIIPARYGASRFPGKPLALLAGRPVIQWVYENARRARMLDEVAVATDDARIFEVVESFGGKAVMTRPDHQSGTDRCAEVVAQKAFEDFDVVVNIQGDEPFLSPDQIDETVLFLRQNDHFDIATLAKKQDNPADIADPNVVKVVFGLRQNALYFSRLPIPFLRQKDAPQPAFYKHIGLYIFRRKALLRIARMAPTPLEKAESLEQLRWLENGLSIGIHQTTIESLSIDTPADLERAHEYLAGNKRA
ncbi:MAG: 3-deoxy-manno-octulosonate cytidylyltransferase [Bacteroidetes bacterium]|nr:MAG: 3-deoxy-manno-octulosonate cytidylyltransferase [Bacteroidota bacterium]